MMTSEPTPDPATFLLLGSAMPVATTVVAYRKGRAIHADAYLRDVYTVAQNLPLAAYYLNVCADRYYIAVLLAAVMLRKKISLLPPNTATQTLQRLLERYQQVVLIRDNTTIGAGNQVMPFDDAISFEKLLETPFRGPTPNPEFPSEQLIGILFTSGSTGEPAPNARTWGALCAGVKAEAQALLLAELCDRHANGGIAVLGTVPAQHSYGLESTLALPLQNGYALAADQSFYPADIIAALALLPRPRVLVTTPFHLRLLINDGGVSLPKLDMIVSATAPLSPQLAAQAEAAFSAPVREIYGCTEAGQIASRRTIDGDTWTLFPDVCLEKRGEATWVHGGHVGEARMLSDVIEIKPDHQFLLHGRVGDLINVAGKRTSLAHLNFHLNSIPGVEDGVFMMPNTANDDWVVRLTAYVVTRTLLPAQILAALRTRIDPVFLPRPVHLVNELPRNQTGKLTHCALNALKVSASANPADCAP
jgi:acyl-coenzyme A synthetase/AMP-(fatty) acid ligase